MEQPQAALPVLPTEVWHEILLYLQVQDLLICRFVSKQWTNFVDNLLDLKIWSPYFGKSRHADALARFLWKSPGTRFSSRNGIDQFMADNKQSGNPSKNPFHRNTLILHWRSIAQYTAVCYRFPELVQVYGDSIHHLVYFVHQNVTASVANIPLIFQMRNLHSLTIYCDDWSTIRNIFDLRERNPFPVAELKSFKNLNLCGRDSKYALDCFFSKLGSQLKRLNIWCRDEAFTTNTVPNVEELKIWDIQVNQFYDFCGAANLTSLKRLSIKLVNMEDSELFGKVDIGTVIRNLEKFAETLESLHLQVSEEHIQKKVHFHNRSLPNVTDLRVPFYFLCGTESHSDRPIFPYKDLAKVFPKLEHLLLVDSRDPVEDWKSYERMLELILESYWKVVVAGVKDLTVRYHRKSTKGNRLVCNFRKTRVDFEAAANLEQK